MALSPVIRSGHLPTHCLNISVKVLARKPAIYDHWIHSWELDIKYYFEELKVWRDLPLLKDTILVKNDELLQDAINTAREGSILLVYPGSYKEDLRINKTLTIASTGGCEKTHIFGEVSMTADGVTLQGITFYPSTKSFSNLKIHSSFVTIVNCRFIENIESIALYSPLPSIAIDCENCLHLNITNNDFYGWKHAVVLKTADSLTVQTNTFRFCQIAVLILTEVAGEVRGNVFQTNVVGIQSPIVPFTEMLLNTNIFSGNVIPLLGDGTLVFYPFPHTRYSVPEHVKISNVFYVNGECDIEIAKNTSQSKCVSIENGE